jgi:ABC-type antimicrobial peptide transport system permease subunit
MDVVIRTSLPEASLLPVLRRRVAQLDSQMALSNVRTEDEWIANSASQPRLNALLLSIFAGLAIFIAALGIYGVLAYSVNLRTREIGIRMALGSPRAAVMTLVIGEGSMILVAGVLAGVIGAFAVGRLLQSLVFGVTARDPAIFAGVIVMLALVGICASAVPAMRASRVDPIDALRQD